MSNRDPCHQLSSSPKIKWSETSVSFTSAITFPVWVDVMPTTRNARGIDLLIYSQDNLQKYSIQVKALSRGNPVPLGKRLDGLWADFFVICRGVTRDSPECFVLLPSEVCTLAQWGEKDGA